MVKVIVAALLVVVGMLGWYVTQSVAEPSAIQASSEREIEHDKFDELSSENPDFISLEEMPDELRVMVTESLALETSNGFVEVSEFEANEIINIEKFIIGFDISNARITFEPSLLPNYIVANYEYLGYTHPNYSIKKGVKNMRNGTLRRLFKSRKSGSMLIVEESSDSVGPGAVLIKEAVNASVAQRPARFSVMKLDDNQTYASLNWTTKKLAYVLYQIDNVENAKESLVRLGSEITVHNNQKN